VILVDTSVWIDLLAKGREDTLRPETLLSMATCGPIVQEVFQGLRPGPAAEIFRQLFLALPLLSDPLPLELFQSAAEIYRQGRSRGVTIRSSTDCLIAAIAIKNAVPVWHKDRDFTAIAIFTPLEIV